MSLRHVIQALKVLLPLIPLLASCAFSRSGTGGGPAEIVPGRRYDAVASWYGPGFHGRRTASGEVYNMDGLTAAHRTYPFGARLKVTNPQTGDSCEVVVNDRGPFVDGVDIDLSRGASRAVKRLSNGPVVIEELGRDQRYVRAVKTGRVSGRGRWRVQAGSFADPENAERLKRVLEFTYTDVAVTRAVVDGMAFNRVQVGNYRDRRQVDELAGRLAYEGYETLIVRE